MLTGERKRLFSFRGFPTLSLLLCLCFGEVCQPLLARLLLFLLLFLLHWSEMVDSR